MSRRDPAMPMDTLTIYDQPQVTLLSYPVFVPPEHMKVNFLGHPPGTDGEKLAEFAGRLCYMSQDNPAGKTTAEYINNIKEQAHGSVLEHANYSILLEGVSRSLTHELVRHRAGFSYSQLSQRYVNESDVGFVVPPAILDLGSNSRSFKLWVNDVRQAKGQYRELADEISMDSTTSLSMVPARDRRKKVREAARSVLPNSTETKIVVTANARAWRTMLQLRCNEGAEREIRRCMLKVLDVLAVVAPSFFNDWEIYTAIDGHQAAAPKYQKV